ncbi:MAG: SPASM domain-containing protein [Candidatus Woesearchaeota archaeon]|jgi:uncharacterized protein|nr:SPASM domain-containing protein [Candidatus Woesearchaeota archaeon]
MAINFLKQDGLDYISNFYRYKLYDTMSGLYLVTLDDGNFLFINKSTLQQLKKGKIVDPKIFEILLQKGVIITEKNFNQIVEKTKKRYEFLNSGTSLHIVIPTHRCNLACVYCFASSCSMTEKIQETDMSDDTALKIVEFIMKSPSNSITIEFQGGEPLVRFDIIKIMVKHANELNKTYKKDLHFALVSNLTLMSDDIADWLIENDVTICTSFDGPKEVHDKNRFFLSKSGSEIGTYEKVVYWVKRINEKYKTLNSKLQVNALMTITKNSLPFYKEIIDEYVKLGLYSVDIRGLTHVGRVEENEDSITYSQENFIEFYEKSLKHLESLREKGTFVFERMQELYAKKVLLNVPGYHTDYESPCGAATGQMTYFNNGEIYTCNEALGRDEFNLGNVYDDNWQKIFKKKETSKAILNSMIEQNVICDRCVYKPYCSTCMVENFYKDKKFNFYPTKTANHHTTIYQSKQIFDKILEELKKQF